MFPVRDVRSLFMVCEGGRNEAGVRASAPAGNVLRKRSHDDVQPCSVAEAGTGGCLVASETQLVCFHYLTAEGRRSSPRRPSARDANSPFFFFFKCMFCFLFGSRLV
ncbi:unnamed protein product [Arctogadus glacialis]